ncbi:MAG: DUF86 domain-containing protein [Candidatus Palauibacterales bacterium]|nr:DUF86 domain-containing protein [Candidatus Palauibacterales bacterium]
MTPLVERLADLREQMEHLREIRPGIDGPEDLERDVGLRNDVLHALLTISQAVIDVAAELASRRGYRYADYTEAVRCLRRMDEFPDHLVERLEPLPGFRNVLVHEYVALEYRQVLDAIDDLGPVADFVTIAAGLETESGPGGDDGTGEPDDVDRRTD